MLTSFDTARDQPLRDFSIGDRRAVVAAVSGGSDSLALLFLLKGWIERNAPAARLIAVTVDHGLRPAAADEARAVAAICARAGIEHRTVAWTGAKPGSGVAEAARLARYRLLAEAAAAAGTDLVVTGHTRDDQAETVAMRAARGDGRGLAGMAGATLFAERVWVLRPLLNARRQALRDLLVKTGVQWIDDPSNDNLAAERVRVRRMLADRLHEVETLVARAELASAKRLRLGAAVADLVAGMNMASPGLFRLPPGVLRAAAPDVAAYALQILTAAIGGKPHLPATDRAGALRDGLLGSDRFAATLSGTAVHRRRADIWLHRERRGLPAPAELAGGQVWDGRFRLRVRAGSAHVSATGAGAREATLPEHAPRGLAVAAMAAEPQVASGSDAEQPANARLERIVAPWALFLPAFDLAPRNAVAKLFGAPPVPAPPFCGPNGSQA